MTTLKKGDRVKVVCSTRGDGRDYTLGATGRNRGYRVGDIGTVHSMDVSSIRVVLDDQYRQSGMRWDLLADPAEFALLNPHLVETMLE